MKYSSLNTEHHEEISSIISFLKNFLVPGYAKSAEIKFIIERFKLNNEHNNI